MIKLKKMGVTYSNFFQYSKNNISNIEEKKFIKQNEITYIIIGLGNYEKGYEKHKHNVGHLFIDYMVKKHDLNTINSTSYSYSLYTCINPNKAKKDPDHQVIFMKIHGLMNNLGDKFDKILKKDKDVFKTEKFKIICDDLETDIGKVKNSWVGGDRGNNGIKSFNRHFKNDSYEKIKIGIGRPDSRDPDIVSDYVLSNFSKKELEIIEASSFLKIENYINLKC